jgi:hypothetical protein
MKSRVCICCGERMARGMKVSPVNPHVCGACFVVVLGNEEADPPAKPAVARVKSKILLPALPAPAFWNS